ncbi:MAG TPA: SCP2 sterol-binding domain-containing protein [Polyangia bacterium]|nr:SCP2 sterol-binding domain-containing protein [Polyangia bacterium]
MANEETLQPGQQPQWHGGNAPGLAGVYGRLRIVVAGHPVATLAVEGTYVVLIPDTNGPADATLICADETVLRKLLKGELNPYIASMRRQARLAGDRGFGTRVMLGLQVGSPFATDANKGDLP